MTSLDMQVRLLWFHFTDEEIEVYGAKGTLLLFKKNIFYWGIAD